VIGKDSERKRVIGKDSERKRDKRVIGKDSERKRDKRERVTHLDLQLDLRHQRNPAPHHRLVTL
jgi:hypothetical protein